MLVGTRRPYDWDGAKMATLLKLRNLEINELATSL